VNKQEIFDIAAQHLIDQGEPCKDVEQCCYKNADGLMCPVGKLMEKFDCYMPQFENEDIVSLFLVYKNVDTNGVVGNALGKLFKGLGIERLDCPKIKMLSCLQNIHDGLDPSYWGGEIVAAAARHLVVTDNLEGLDSL